MTSIYATRSDLPGATPWKRRSERLLRASGLPYTIVHPVTAHAISGLSATERDHAASCPVATIREGLAVRGEEVGSADAEVRSRLRRIRALGD